MLDFETVIFTFRKADGADYVILRAHTPEYNLPRDDPRPPVPMASVYFYWTRAEFKHVVAGKQAMSVDGYHLCKHDGEQWTFFDWEMPQATTGRADIPFRVVSMPYQVQKIILRLARWHFKHLDRAPKGTEHEVEIPKRTWRRLLERYGQAKGCVNVDPHGTDALTRAATDQGLRDKLDQLKRIARNTTFNVWESAVVNLHRDSAGYYFDIRTPKGIRSMNGGVINHGSDEKPDWSIHT